VPGGIIQTLGVEAIFDPTLPYLGEAADITVANLESPLCSVGTPHPTKPIIFRGSPENVAGLVHAGIDVVSLANNHVIDYDLEGMRQTQAVLSEHDILFSGAGAHSYEAYLPLFCITKGVNSAFLASCNRTGQYDNYQPYLNAGYSKPGFAYLTEFHTSKQIATVEDDADLIIVEMHAGNEYSLIAPRTRGLENEREDEFYSPFFLVPRWDDIQLRHHAIDEGADLVVCHHPHLLQAFEVYNGKLIAHSLGDFVFDLNYPETFPSVILKAYIDETGIYDYSVTPVYIDDYIPRRAHGELGLHIMDYLARRSRELGTYMIVQRDSVTARIILDTLNLTPTFYFYSNELSLNEENGYWISNPLCLARNGSIATISSITPVANWKYRLGRAMTWLWFGNFEDEGSTLWLLNQPGEFYDTIPYQGERSLCHSHPVGSSGILTNLERRIPCYSDSTYYTLYGYIKTGDIDSADIIIKFYSNRYQSHPIGERDLGTDIIGTTDWTFYYRDFVPANNTGYIDIWLQSRGPQSTDTGYVWFDNVGVIEWDEWQPFGSVAEISTPNDYYWVQIKTDVETYTAQLSYDEIMYDATPVHERVVEKLPFQLFRSYPNPVRSNAHIRYNLRERAAAVLRIYNILGQEVRTLVNEIQSPGHKSIIWDGKDNQGRVLSSGVYFYRLHVGEYAQSQKLILLK
jgi:poly-gamma-glutamate capsule biosynthesis protein CapA/YwtB (metallophosphatase superfamily)